MPWFAKEYLSDEVQLVVAEHLPQAEDFDGVAEQLFEGGQRLALLQLRLLDASLVRRAAHFGADARRRHLTASPNVKKRSVWI